jgi:pantetheine-phosphate adenylyltransferase
MNYRIAIYPGSFDPITKGHLDIIKRASLLFESVVIGIAEHSGKTPFFTSETRLKMINEVLDCEGIKNCSAKVFKGLLVDFAKKENAGVIVRGLRAVSDFEYEFQMACVNSRLEKNLETIFLPSSNNDMHFISSRFVKSIAELGGDISSFVPNEVIKYFAR